MSITVRGERDLALLTSLWPAWKTLSERALVANPFFEPWFLLPALRHLDDQADACVLLVEDGPRLIGLCPLALGPLRLPNGTATPLRQARLLRNRYSMDHTPLLDRDRAHEALCAILDFLVRENAPVLELDHARADGAFARLVRQVAKERRLPSFARHSHERALFIPSTDAEAYLARAYSGRQRKDLRRNERGLQQAGRLELPELRPGEARDPGPFIEDFLSLEARGWKGEAGGAFASRPADRAFFEEVVRAGVDAGRIWFQSVTVDGAAVAMLCNLVVGEGSFSWKITYDESYAKHSPGLFIKVLNLRRLHERREIAWMDSGAIPDHPLIDRLWPDRRPMENRWLATGGLAGRLFVDLLPLARLVTNGARSLVGRGRRARAAA